MIVFGPQATACIGQVPCDGSWVQLSSSRLEVGETAKLSTASSVFAFYLGNALSGTFNVSLSPAYRIQEVPLPAYVGDGYVPAHDELTVHVASRFAVLSNTDLGHASFVAQTGADYYLFLEGKVRGAQDYSLQVTSVPEPENYAMLLAGLGLMLSISRFRKLRETTAPRAV